MKQLHNAQDAIEQAILVGNYKNPLSKKDAEAMAESYSMLAIEESLLDPLFWQALGKARGWKTSTRFMDISEMIRGVDMHFALKWFETRLSSGDEEQFWLSLP